MIRLEKALDDCLERLKGRLNNDFHDDFDDMDSIASGGLGSTSASINSTRVVRFSVQERKVEQLRTELSKAAKENAKLREELAELKKRLLVDDDLEEKKRDDNKMVPVVDLSYHNINHETLNAGRQKHSKDKDSDSRKNM